MEKDQKFVEMVVKEIVDNPDKVTTERKVDEMGVLIELTVDPSDMGKIIGKEGKTAKAIRTLLRVLGAKEHARVNLKIIEPEGGTGAASGNDEISDEAPKKENIKDDLEENSSKLEEVETPVEEVKADEDEEEITPLEESTTSII